ncbi:YggU family protein [bacterium]|nr:YggU family protein [bacterium]
MINYLSENNDGAILTVKLVPNSSFSKIVDYTDDFIRIKISAPPIENKANKELIDFCSKAFDVNKSKIQIISGDKSKLKKILFKDVSCDYISQKLIFVLDSLKK